MLKIVQVNFIKKKKKKMSLSGVKVIKSKTITQKPNKNGVKRKITLASLKENVSASSEVIPKLQSTSAPGQKSTLRVPELLLSYTYFLNSHHSCYIRVGYDAESFKLKIVLYKNMIFQEWHFEDWNNLHRNTGAIQKYFQSNEDVGIKNDDAVMAKNIVDPRGSSMTFKLLKRSRGKCIMFQTAAARIKMFQSEWEELFVMMDFLNSVINWCSVVWHEIEQYYNLYYQKCIQLQIIKLPPNEFFIPIPSTFNYCNFSRLFNEIPVLCKNRLQQDLYFNINPTINSNLNTYFS